jgi:hypothetical protein
VSDVLAVLRLDDTHLHGNLPRTLAGGVASHLSRLGVISLTFLRIVSRH